MNTARQHAHELLDQLAPADAAIIERLMESITQPALGLSGTDLDDAIQAGLDSLNRGASVDADSVFDRLDSELAAIESNGRG